MGTQPPRVVDIRRLLAYRPIVASIEQRGASYRVVWRHRGRKRSATFPTRLDAETAQRLVEVRHGDITADGLYTAVFGPITTPGDPEVETPPTVAEWATQWLTRREIDADVQPDTITRQRQIIERRILPRLGVLPVTAVTPEVVADWLTWVRQQPSRRGGLLDADTVRRAHSTLHALLGAAVGTWLTSNPAAPRPGDRKVRGLPRSTPHEAVFLTPPEVQLILTNCDRHIRDLVDVAVHTGLRLGELLVLRVDDLVLTGPRRVIRVRRALKQDGTIGAPKSRRSRRDVQLSPDMVRLLTRRVTGRARHDLVFPAPRGGLWNPSNLRNKHWLPAVAAAMRCPQHPPPLPPKPQTGPRREWRPDEVSTCDCPTRLHRRPRFHDLRHTHASMCVALGWDLLRVSRRMGHESTETTTRIYGHLWPDESPERLDGLDRLLRTADGELGDAAPC